MKRTPTRLGLILALAALAADDAPDPAVGTSYRVPYRVTDTNHFLVRVRINGEGPFNFLVDTGAPALFVGTEAAKGAGLEPSKTDFFTVVDRLDFEGGPTLKGIKARIEDPFQLVGMNALGLPGASIDGILGFSALARFRIELDPTSDRMTWTRIDFEPREPVVRLADAKKGTPAGVQAMNVLGPIAKLAATFVGKQPEDRLHPRGFLGLELAESDGQVRASGVLADSPAAEAGVQVGDVLIKLLDRDLDGLKAAHEAAATIKPGDPVALRVRRGSETMDLTLTAAEGF